MAKLNKNKNNALEAKMEKGFKRLEGNIEDLAIMVGRGFEQVDKRFEQVDKRFEQIDKRFEQVDKRFEQMDEKLGLTEQRLGQKIQGLDFRMDDLSENRVKKSDFGILRKEVEIIKDKVFARGNKS